MVLELSAKSGDYIAVEIIDKYNSVGITHRHSCDGDSVVANLNRCFDHAVAVEIHRYFSGCGAR